MKSRQGFCEIVVPRCLLIAKLQLNLFSKISVYNLLTPKMIVYTQTQIKLLIVFRNFTTMKSLPIFPRNATSMIFFSWKMAQLMSWTFQPWPPNMKYVNPLLPLPHKYKFWGPVYWGYRDVLCCDWTGIFLITKYICKVWISTTVRVLEARPSLLVIVVERGLATFGRSLFLRKRSSKEKEPLNYDKNPLILPPTQSYLAYCMYFSYLSYLRLLRGANKTR